jgi:hypothetical protein
MSEAYLKLMEYVTTNGYISQEQYLDLFPQDMDKAELLIQIYEMEQQGIFKANRTEKTTVYYLADVVFH